MSEPVMKAEASLPVTPQQAYVQGNHETVLSIADELLMSANDLSLREIKDGKRATV